ncbi:MAG: ATP-binding protein, partial [Syntrophaceae bacterium]|nr:ATP-binding protein [Syntrophaceae bacterium]
VKFEIGVVTIHPGHRVFDPEPLIQRLTVDHITHEVLYKNLTAIVNHNLTPGTNPCSFCSRLRRGILYSHAAQNNWNKIALGHHADDFIETLMLNIIFNGSIKGMSPKLEADDKRNIVIRPLVYVNERQTKAFAIENKVPLLDCSCPFEGGSNHRRKWVKNLISQIEKDAPNVKSSMLSAMGRIHARHLLQTGVVSGDRKAD